MQRLAWTIPIGAAAFAAAAGSAATGPIVYVDDDASPGGQGTSWFTAYRFLQDALAAAADPRNGITEIRVAQGTYWPDLDAANPLGSGDRAASFGLISAVSLVGGFGGADAPDPDERDPDLYVTVLSGDLEGDDDGSSVSLADNSYHVVSAAGTDQTATLDGFTITAGNADVYTRGGGLHIDGGAVLITRCTFTANHAADRGGAVANFGGDTCLLDCTFIGNEAPEAAGVYSEDGDIELTDCLFDDNDADWGTHLHTFQSTALIEGCTFQNGSGLHGVVLERGSATLADCAFTGHPDQALLCLAIDIDVFGCLFSGNSAQSQGAAVYLAGGYRGTFARFYGCRFEANHAGHCGTIFVSGGQSNFARLWAFDCDFVGNTAGDPDSATPIGVAITTLQGPTQLYGCRFLGNTTTGGPENPGWGGALFFWKHAGYRIVNCLFSGNSAEIGVVSFQWATADTSHVDFSGCTLVNNVSTDAAGAIYFEPGTSVNVTDSVLWSNGGTAQSDQINGGLPGDATVSYSCIQGLDGSLGGIGNIADDPLFVNAAGPDRTPGTDDDDARLGPGSPCLDAGHNWGLPPDEEDLDGDGDTLELVPIDLAGNPRLTDHPLAGDTGCGERAVVDMGAYEAPGVAGEGRFADLDGNGEVRIEDLLALLACWADAGGDCCLADLDLDGTVGIGDFLILLAEWG